MGFACADPATIRECELTEYCAEGTKGFAKCPSGFACPSPTSKHLCAAGAYCSEGKTVYNYVLGRQQSEILEMI